MTHILKGRLSLIPTLLWVLFGVPGLDLNSLVSDDDDNNDDIDDDERDDDERDDERDDDDDEVDDDDDDEGGDDDDEGDDDDDDSDYYCDDDHSFILHFIYVHIGITGRQIKSAGTTIYTSH